MVKRLKKDGGGGVGWGGGAIRDFGYYLIWREDDILVELV